MESPEATIDDFIYYTKVSAIIEKFFEGRLLDYGIEFDTISSTFWVGTEKPQFKTGDEARISIRIARDLPLEPPK